MKPKQGTLIVLQGLPGSGKSTEADKLLEMNHEGDETIKLIRINRSTLRNMLWPRHKWTKEYEAVVREVEFNTASAMLHSGFTVIIDSTNLYTKGISRWRKLAGRRFAFIVIDLRKTPLEVCLRRNDKRENKCTPDLIVSLARKHNLLKIGEGE